MRSNIGLIVRELGRLVPEREAIVWRDRHISYRTFADRCERLARVLQGAGLGAHSGGPPPAPWEAGQDLVLLFMTNCPEYLEASVGAYLGRVAPANVNYRYTPDELRYLLDDSKARAVVIHRRFLPVWQKTVASCGLEFGSFLTLVVEDGSDEEIPPGALAYELALATVPDIALDEATPDDVYIVYTGGTTGFPKGVLWTQADFLAGPLNGAPTLAQQLDRGVSKGATLRTLPAAPLMHGAAHWNALNGLVSGGTVVLQANPEHLDVDDVLDTVERERCSSLQIVGDVFARPLMAAQRTRPRDLSSLRLLVNGGTILSEAMKSELKAAVAGLRIMDVLGSSESGRQAIAGGSDDGKFQRLESTVVLSEDRTRKLSPGDPDIGWLASGGWIPRGYLGDQEKTADTFPVAEGERYVVAGDRARLLADGSIQLHGRESVTINTGGEKVFAEEVEQAIKVHPDVWDVVVIGRPSERWGQEVVAIVQLCPGVVTPPSDEELRSTCAEEIARYKLPKAFITVDRVQRTASSKPDYKWARELAMSAPEA